MKRKTIEYVPHPLQFRFGVLNEVEEAIDNLKAHCGMFGLSLYCNGQPTGNQIEYRIKERPTFRARFNVTP